MKTNYSKQPGYSGHKFEGRYYNQTKDLDITAIAKLVKEELIANYPELAISVKTRRYSGGQSIDVDIAGFTTCPFNEHFVHMWIDGCEWSEINKYYFDNRGEDRYTPKYHQVKKNAESILSQYKMDDSDCSTDYFHVNFYGHVNTNVDEWYEKINPNHPDVIRTRQWKDESRIREEKVKAAREARKQQLKDSVGGDIIPKFALAEATILFRGGKEITYNAIVTKSVSPSNGHSYYYPTYSVRVRGEAGQFPEAAYSSHYNDVAMKSVKPVKAESWDEFVTRFKYIMGITDQETFTKYYEKKARKAFDRSDSFPG